MPAPTPDDDKPARVASLGRYLLLAYLIPYVKFVFDAAFRPEFMAKTGITGEMNVATEKGMFLILLPLGLAAIYMIGCKRIDRSFKDGKGQG